MIDAQLTSFLHDGVGIHIGTRNERLEPNGARAIASRVEEDGAHLTVYVAKVAAARVLPDLESNGLAAIVFGRPTDDRACQVKATFVSARAARVQERPRIMAQWRAFLENLERIGIPRDGMEGWTTWPAVAIRLRATAIFNQTPGPEAGAPLA
jgi:hypothetical protein